MSLIKKYRARNCAKGNHRLQLKGTDMDWPPDWYVGGGYQDHPLVCKYCGAKFLGCWNGGIRQVIDTND